MESTKAVTQKRNKKIPSRKPVEVELVSDSDMDEVEFEVEPVEQPKKKVVKRKMVADKVGESSSTQEKKIKINSGKTQEKSKVKVDITMPTIEDFMQKVENEKPLKWKELSQNELYIVESVDETILDDAQTGERKAYIGNFKDRENKDIRVWLPGLVSKNLNHALNNNIGKEKVIIIRPLGEKVSKRTNRTYQNFIISYY